MKLEFLEGFSKNREVQNCIQIRPEGAELFHEDEQKDMTKQIVAFPNFANAPESTLISNGAFIRVPQVDQRG